MPFFDPSRDIPSGVRYTVELMHDAPVYPRSTPLHGAPALLAVLAILMATPAIGGGAAAQGPVGLSLARMVAAPSAVRVFVSAAPVDGSAAMDHPLARADMELGQARRVLGTVDRLGPLRLVLPPPFTC